MDDRGKQFLKAYLEIEGNESLHKYLQPETLEELQNLPELSIPSYFNPSQPLEKIHWSWFLPILQESSDEEKKILLAAFPEHGAKALSEALQIEPESTLTSAGKSYFSQVLFQSFLQSNPAPLPPECLPESSLNRLTTLSKKDLLRLIDSLSLFDLAIEIRQIVETKILKKLYSFLQEGEKAFLKQVSITKEGPLLPKMGLDRWDGTEEALRHLLHKRGVQRFAIALSGSHPDLIWHIAHQLDRGRGGTLLKLVAPERVPQWTELAIHHIEDWINRL